MLANPPPAPVGSLLTREAVPGLVWAFRLHHDGRAEALPIDAPIEPSHDGRLWLHFNLTDVRTRAWLANMHIPQLARDLLLSNDNFQQIHVVDNCVYGVFSDLVRDVEAATRETGFLRFAMTERLLISGRHQALCSADATRRVLEGGHRVSSVAALLEKIVDEIADTMDRMADKIGTDIDAIEERVLAEDTGSELRKNLSRMRRTCVRLHRQLAGLRVLFHRLEQKNTDNLSPALRLQAGKLAQRLDGLDHDIVELHERSRLLEEELRFKLEEESNKHLHALSVVTMMLLPPTLVTGIFGMNTKGLPLTDVDSGFLVAAGLLVGSALLAYLLMRRLGIVK
ncbi:zinc transporter [Bradyrhizobium elkanii]|jgi:zinc transporter|uniref:Zinc transporter n=1 Tax=Bradyrhizobium elkanii TaxID=29448 RepID=A0ABV4EYF3_BRAEL|nr:MULTISPECIES: transporter [Bradyrhizobium]MCP1730486.1 zinc transporter [Bradyrhizobium elkanii]MCP1757221.1 zinc transporter [Bradyrhizobium elkanii]MCP1930949.1 zinc transporter [Bradyrhizobium elkanii]MCP1982735.1 zinc transporter [Bradyrhizobium elkanii]MCS3480833.1 zinc transporter [Bradyrhizobium elkanii]